MTYANLKTLSAAAFKRYSGVKRETFAAMLEALEVDKQQKEARAEQQTLA